MTDPTPTRDEAVLPITPERLAEVRERFSAIPHAEPDSLTGHVKGMLALIDSLASAPAPASGRVDAVRVEPLKFVRPPNAKTMIKAETILGAARIWSHHEANGAWFWELGDFASGTEASKGDAHKMLVATYQHRILSALSPAATPVSEAEQVERVRYCWEVIQGQCSDGDGFTERAAMDLELAIAALEALAKPASSPAGVREAAELLSHLKLYVLEKLDVDDADALRDRMHDLTAALSQSTSAGRVE